MIQELPTQSEMCFQKLVQLVFWSCLILELFLLLESPISLSPPGLMLYARVNVCSIKCSFATLHHVISNSWWERRVITVAHLCFHKRQSMQTLSSPINDRVLIEQITFKTDSRHKHLLNVVIFYFA